MEKIAGGPEVADVLSLDRPLGEVIASVAERKGKPVGDVTIIVLDRPRHEDGVRQIREVGARVRFISDGDVSAALFAVTAEEGSTSCGNRRTPEGVLGGGDQVPRRQLLGRCGRATTTSAAPRWTPATTSTRSRRRPACRRRRRLLRRHRRHRRRAAGRPLHPRRKGDDRVARDALALGTVRTVSARHDQAKLREVTGGRYD